MKALPVLLVAAGLPVWLLLQRPQRVEIYPDQPVFPGRTNPPLRKLDSHSPITAGAHLWFKTNRTPFGLVVSNAPDHEFPNGQGPGVLVQDLNQKIWMPRRALNGSWTDQ